MARIAGLGERGKGGVAPKKEQGLRARHKREGAQALADKFEQAILDIPWSSLVDSIEGLKPSVRKYLIERVRWTLIDEATGENLLESANT